MVDHGILEIRFRVLVLQRVFEKSRFCHISPTMFPRSSFQTAGANPSPRTVSLDLPGLFKHPLSQAVHQGRMAQLVREGAQMSAQHLRDLENRRRHATLIAVLLDTEA